MRTITKQEVIEKADSYLLTPIAFLQFISIFAFFGSPFLWIWVSWAIAWRVCITGLLGTFLFYGLYKLIKTAIREGVEKDKTLV